MPDDVEPDDLTGVVDSVDRGGADSIWIIDCYEVSVLEDKAVHFGRVVDESSTT